MAKSVLRRLTPQDLIEIRKAVAYDPTVPNGLRWLAKRKGRKPSGIGQTFWIGQVSYQAPHIVMILNDRWPSAGDSVVTRIDKNGPWGEVDNLKWASMAQALTEGREHNRQDLLKSVLGNDVPDLGEKFRLAGLCKKSHKWNGNPVSLQVKDGPGWRCKECKALQSINKSQRAPRKTERRWIPELKGLPAAERKLKYRRMLRESLVSQGLTTRGTQLKSPAMQAALLGDKEQRAMWTAIRQSGQSPSVARLVMNEQRRYWRENPEASREHKRQWSQASWWLNYQIRPELRLYTRQKSKRRKALERGSVGIQVKGCQITKRFAEFGHRCAYCGATGDLHIEHVNPISKGGTHVLSNVVPACQSCNYSKRAKDAETWYRAQPFFCRKRWAKILKVMGAGKGSPQQLALL